MASFRVGLRLIVRSREHEKYLRAAVPVMLDAEMRARRRIQRERIGNATAVHR